MSKPYSLPAAIVQEEFIASPPGVIQPQTAVIIGDEKAVFLETDAGDLTHITYGAYIPGADTTYAYGGLPVGAVVDLKSPKLILQGILALYADFTGTGYIQRGTVANVLNIPVQLGFQHYNNGTTDYLRNTTFKNRDVQIGDRVKISDPNNVIAPLTTRIVGFVNDVVAAVVPLNATATANPAQQAYSGSVTPVDVKSTDHVATINVAGTSFIGNIPKGQINDVYTVTVITAGAPATAVFSVTSTNGDNVASVTSVAFGSPVAIGTRGLRIQFASTGSQAFVLGEKYTFTVAAAYARYGPARTTGAAVYNGLFDTVYKITVVKGGLWSENPQVMITSSTGIDAAGPLTVAFNTSLAIGTLGVAAKFGQVISCTTTNSATSLPVPDSSLLAVGMKVSGTGIQALTTITAIPDGTHVTLSLAANASATNNITFDLPQGGLVLNDVYTLAVTASKNGAVRTAVLAHALDAGFTSGTAVDVQFFIYKATQTIPSVGYPAFSSTALTAGTSSFTVKAGVSILDPTWTDNDAVTLLALPVKVATVIVPYTALLTANQNILRTISDEDTIGVILGKQIPENPLAYGVLKAMENSAGQPVSFISIQSHDLTGFQAALEELETHPDPYFRIPLTRIPAILDLFEGHILSETSDEKGNRCAGFTATKLDPVALKYDKKANGDNYTGYVAVEPGSNPAIYTRVTVPGAQFITDGIRPTDEFRSLFSVDAFGNPTYVAVLINSIIDEENLILVAPAYSQAIGSSGSLQRIQIARNLTKDEQADVESAASSAFDSRHMFNVFPDIPLNSNVPGYFVACAVAGLASSVAPHQPITNYTLNGFSDQTGTQKRFTPTQLNTMAEGGTLIVTQARTGGPIYIRHQLSTDNSDDLHSELSVKRNYDSIASYLLEGLDVFVGKYNITDNFLQLLDVQLRQRLNNLVANTSTPSAGPQIISWDPASLIITQNPVNRTEVDIVVDIVLPMPANKIQLKLRASA